MLSPPIGLVLILPLARATAGKADKTFRSQVLPHELRHRGAWTTVSGAARDAPTIPRRPGDPRKCRRKSQREKIAAA